MNRRILVTGSKGFVGSHLVTALANVGFEVVGFDLDQGNILNYQFNLDGIRHVFHLAARTFIPASWEEPFEFYKTNLLGTLNVLDACRKSGCSLTYLNAYPYGQPLTNPINEEHPLSATTPYNHSKILAEYLCRFYSEKFNLSIVILRAFNLYGPGQNETFLIPHIIRQTLDPKIDIIKIRDLRPKRDYLYIEDAIQAMILSCGHKGFSIYNLGSGNSYNVEDIINNVKQILKIEKKYISLKQERKGEILDMVADISKIERDLGWQPKISFNEGIRKTIEVTKRVY
jgi:nucleoside-diphosphate-sugar epimerase